MAHLRRMTTLIILGASAAAILALIGLNAWLGGWTPSKIDSLDVALTRLESDYLRLSAGEAFLSEDRRAAFVEDQNSDRTGLVIAQGDILVTRLVCPDELAKAETDDAHLAIRFRDFTFPAVRVDMGNAETAQRWARRLTGQADEGS
jgi:cell division protein FtsB